MSTHPFKQTEGEQDCIFGSSLQARTASPVCTYSPYPIRRPGSAQSGRSQGSDHSARRHIGSGSSADPDASPSPLKTADHPTRRSVADRNASPSPLRTTGLRKSARRPPSELFLPSPEDTARRPFQFSLQPIANRPSDVFLDTDAVADGVARMKIQDDPYINSVQTPPAPQPLHRAMTAPAGVHTENTNTASAYLPVSAKLRRKRLYTQDLSNGLNSTRSPTALSPNSRRRTVLFSGVDKDKRASLSASQRRSAPVKALGKVGSRTGRTSVSQAEGMARGVSTEQGGEDRGRQSSIVMPWRRRQVGETMSMLLDSGFFDQGRDGSPVEKLEKMMIDVTLEDLPPTPPSAASTRSSFGGTPVQTPVEIYHPDSPETPRRRPISYKGSAKKRQRSPLAAVREVNGKMNALPPVIEDESDTTQLAPPPEGGVAQEDRRPSQVAEQPAPLEIHLSTGAVVTVKPPELTAWQLSIYLQGPVRLPKPAVVPRNGSIASLEPFQEAVERVYQDALIIPRRKSDDAVVDDVCEWFEEFGFGYGSFGHEHFKIFEDEILTETETETVSKPLPAVASGGQFGSLPGSRPASLVLPDNAEVAQENQGPRRTSVPITVQDPTPEEENPPSPTTATPNIAHPPLPHSHISPSASPHTPSTSVLPLPENTTPPPRTPPLRSPSLASSFLSNRGSKSSFEWDVEETSARPPWLMTGRDSNKRRSVFKVPPPPKRASQNPVAKMRNLVRTASAIL